MKHQIVLNYLENQVRKFKLFIIECEAKLHEVSQADYEARSTFQGHIDVYTHMVNSFENAIKILEADTGKD